MLKILLTALVMLLPLMRVSAVTAAEGATHEVILKEDEKDIKKELEYKIKTHLVFLRTAAQIVEETKNKEALSFIKMADASAKEAMVHYRAGDYELSLEDFSESTQKAIHAITLARNPQDVSVRDFVIQEELILNARKDRERKLGLINKGAEEVKVFLRTAGRLLSENKNDSAAKKVAEAKSLFESSKAALAADDLDASIDDMNSAYRLVTNAIKEIKSTQQDIITFPRPAGNEDKDLLEYELKRNDAYVYFASQVVKEDDAKAVKILNAGKAVKAEADGALKDGNTKKAISKLKESTDLLIKAVKSTVRE